MREVLSTSLAIITHTDQQDINLARQEARDAFMESIRRRGFDPVQFVASADRWWPNTIGEQEDYA